MASSKVMATSRARNPDHPTATTATASSSSAAAAAQPPPRSRSRSRRAPPSSSSAPHTPTKPQLINLPSPLSSQSTMTVDGILHYSTPSAATAAESTLLEAQITLIENPTPPPTAIEAMNSPSSDHLNINGNNAAACNIQETVDSGVVSAKTVDDVWREIVAGRKDMKEEPMAGDEMMTLEDFLVKAGAVDDEDDDDDDDDNVKMEPMHTERLSGGIYAFEPAPTPPPPPPPPHHHHHLVPMTSGGGFQVEGSVIGFGNGVEVVTGGSGGGGGGGGGVGGRGKRGRGPLLEPMDKAAQQRQRRMIKNRESAARSRERKQAYQVELESLAVRLEEENELLTKEKEERAKERFKQLMEKVVPVVEKRRPPCVLRRFRSL